MTAPGQSGKRLLQGFTQNPMVINFTVKYDQITAACRLHGLLPCGRQIDDGKATVCETYMLRVIVPISGSIRATMTDFIGHPLEQFIKWLRSNLSEKAGNSTHQKLFNLK